MLSAARSRGSAWAHVASTSWRRHESGCAWPRHTGAVIRGGLVRVARPGLERPTSEKATIKVGYLVCQQSPAGDIRRLLWELVEEARVAESVGFDGVFVSEHHQRPDNYIPNPLLLSSLLSHQTSRVNLGITVAILPLYHPVRLAEDAALGDQLSGGRLILGGGAGSM